MYIHHRFKKSFRQPGNHLASAGLLVGVLLILVSCGEMQPAEEYGFVTTLGRDTISVESVSRQGNTVTTDGVDRFPRVRVRHSVISLENDGSIRRLEMDIHTPSEPEDQRNRKVIADVNNNKVHLTKADKSGTVNRDFATDSAIVVAHVPQEYALYELYFAAALKNKNSLHSPAGTPVKIRQFYIDREFDRFPLGRATVTPLENGKIEVFHDWLSGTGEATVDSNYHLLNYNGDRTTYKVKVVRVSSPPDIKDFAERFESQEAQGGPVKQLSVRDSATAQIGNARFAIDYARPLQRGRTLLGDVITYDKVWRTGANAATQFSTSANIKIGDLSVPAGTYTLFTIPHQDGTDLIINKQSGQWGTEYHSSMNLGIIKMESETSDTLVEAFTMSIRQGSDEKHGTLVMEWGSFKWSVGLEVQ